MMFGWYSAISEVKVNAKPTTTNVAANYLQARSQVNLGSCPVNQKPYGHLNDMCDMSRNLHCKHDQNLPLSYTKVIWFEKVHESHCLWCRLHKGFKRLMVSLGPKRPRLDTIELTVHLPSGTSTPLSLPRCCMIHELKLKICEQESLGEIVLNLVAPDGHILDASQSVEAASLQNGDTITAIKSRLPKISATTKLAEMDDVMPFLSNAAFAMWFPGSDSVGTWGESKVVTAVK